MSVTVHPTQEAAIAEAMRGAEPGTVIAIHTSDCGVVRSGEAEITPEREDELCTCEPLEIVVGAQA